MSHLKVDWILYQKQRRSLEECMTPCGHRSTSQTPSSLSLPLPNLFLVPAIPKGSSMPSPHLLWESFPGHSELNFSLILSLYHLSPGGGVFLTGSLVAMGAGAGGGRCALPFFCAAQCRINQGFLYDCIGVRVTTLLVLICYSKIKHPPSLISSPTSSPALDLPANTQEEKSIF